MQEGKGESEGAVQINLLKQKAWERKGEPNRKRFVWPGIFCCITGAGGRMDLALMMHYAWRSWVSKENGEWRFVLYETSSTEAFQAPQNKRCFLT
jgi:hypothetical protein